MENAYLILPEQEEMAKTPQGRKMLVQALYEGILNFYGVKIPQQKAAVKKPAAKRYSQKPMKTTYLRPATQPELRAK